MMKDHSHFRDDVLLRDVDGELKRWEKKRVHAHLEICWTCRARRAELEHAIANFASVHQQLGTGDLPPAEGPRALLQARIAQLATKSPAPSLRWLTVAPECRWAVGLLLSLLVFGLSVVRVASVRGRSHSRTIIVVMPDSRLTPGATVLASRGAICAQPDTKNKVVPTSLQKKVFDEYGIPDADPSAYEVDYLVTPALGGADDIHNLWPHSYASTDWNAHVKDQLEDYLRDLVCEGRLDLASAQQEIAANWVAAYKKYFRTERPLEMYCRKCTLYIPSNSPVRPQEARP